MSYEDPQPITWPDNIAFKEGHTPTFSGSVIYQRLIWHPIKGVWEAEHWDDSDFERLRAIETKHTAALALVNEQAEDDGLWFVARTAPEAYLQQELRRLHAALEEA